MKEVDNNQKVKWLYAAIDAIILANDATSIDSHFFVDSENSVVSKLRTEIFRIEDSEE